MSATRTFLVGGGTAVITRIIYALAQIGYLAVMARLLEPSDFGVFALATAITSLATILTDFGFSTAIYQCDRLNSRLASALFWVNLGLALVLMVILLLCRNLFGFFFDMDKLSEAVFVLALALPFSSVASLFKAILSRWQMWRAVYPGFLICQLAAIVLSALYAIFIRPDYTALLVTPLATALLSALIFWWHLRWLPRFRLDFRNSLHVLGQGAALSTTGISNYLNRQSDNLLIGWKWPAVDLGIYTRAYSMFSIPNTIIINPLAPVILSALSRNKNDDIKWMPLWSLISLPLAIIASLNSVMFFRFSSVIVDMLYGAGWEQAAPITSVLSMSILPMTIGQLILWAMISKKMATNILAFSLITSALRFVAFAFAVQYGVLAVATTWTVTSWLFTFALIILAYRKSVITLDRLFGTLAPISLGLIAAIIIAEVLAQINPVSSFSELGLFNLAEILIYVVVILSSTYLHAMSRTAVKTIVKRLIRKFVDQSGE